MGLCLRVITNTIKKMDKVSSNGQIKHHMMEALFKICFKAEVHIAGLTVKNTRVIGQLIKCMDMEHTLGQMDEHILEISKTIKSADTAL